MIDGDIILKLSTTSKKVKYNVMSYCCTPKTVSFLYSFRLAINSLKAINCDTTLRPSLVQSLKDH